MKTPHLTAILITVLLAVAAVAGDYFLKLASSQKSPFQSWQFGVGLGIYGLSAAGLVLVMPHLNLAHLGVWYSITMVLCLCLLGTFVFGETLKLREWVGVAMAVVSLVLLSRLS
jgi:small multidrug resistance pump